jgi:sporulation-control protein spo0M
VWAEEARARGLSAWVQEAYEPKDLYVVLAVLTDDSTRAKEILHVARERGYSDAYIMGRPAK